MERAIRLIEPKVICTLGNFATKLLTGQPTGITRVRGRPQERELGGLQVVTLPAVPSRRGTAYAGASSSSCARTSHRLPGADGATQSPQAEPAAASAGRPGRQLGLFGRSR